MKTIFLVCCLAVVGLAATGRRQIGASDELLKKVVPFRPGNEYFFRYNSQIALGLGSDAVDQKSTHRLSALAKFHFESERSAVFRFEDVRIAVLNGEIDPRRVQPMQLFETNQIDSTLLEELEMPVKFDYSDGIVGHVYFNSKDSAWSKNVKRAVLNAIQLNLKRRTLNVDGIELEKLRNENQKDSEMFTLPEETLEGECQTVYIIDNSEDEETKAFNVTKSIDFRHCKKTPIIRYGPRPEKSNSETKQREIEEQQMDRSTVFRYQLVGSPENYGIGRVEIVSQYVYKVLNAETEQALNSVVLGELVFETMEKKSSKAPQTLFQSKEESLMYSTEWDKLQKRFFYFGDEEFTQKNSPFAKIHNKVQMIQELLQQLSRATADKINGIETETTLKMQQLVELVRMCSVKDLNKIHSEIQESEIQNGLLIDALAVAGTRNTIHFLIKEIRGQKMSAAKSVQVFQQLSGLPAPSTKQIDMVLDLCKSELVQDSVALSQSCWLTAGSMIGEICRENARDSVEDSEEQCTRHQKETFHKILMAQFRNAKTPFEKVIALKAIGNAAMDICVLDLEKIIADRRESTIVRQQAIDSLRRLRNQMPKKIQRILLPVFKDAKEQPELRMTAFSMMMHTIPSKSVLDQITYTLLKERNQHVRSFVRSMMESLSESPIEVEQEMAKHLKTVLKMSDSEDDQVRGSRFYRVPIYSLKQSEGLFMNWEFMFSAKQKHLAVQLDSLLNGLYNKNGFEIRLTQNNLEHYYKKLVSGLSQGTPEKKLRGNRRSSSNFDGQQILDSIYENLKIQSREDAQAQPLGIFCIRVADVDQVVLPISDETMPESLKSIVNNGKLELTQLLQLLEGQEFRFASLLSLHERAMKVPTSCGMPIHILHNIPVLGSIDGKFQAKIASAGVKMTLKAQPLMSAVHLQKMELWTPIMSVGVETLRSVEMNLPINVEFSVSEKMDQVKMVLRLPERKTRIFGFHTLPLTYTRSYDSETGLYREAKVKAVRNIPMEANLVQFEIEEFGNKILAVSGHFHQPISADYENILAVLMTTENHVHVEFEPSSETMEEIEVVVAGKTFEAVSKEPAHPQFETFYEKAEAFEAIHQKDEESLENVESVSDRRQKLSKWISSKYSPRQMYKHAIEASYKTVGGRKQHQGKLQLDAVCDSQLTYCKINVEARQTMENKQDWTLKSSAKILLPEYVREISQLNDAKSEIQNKMLAVLKAEWGTDKIEKVELKLQGERALPQNWNQRAGSEWRRELATAFLNKFHAVAVYQLSPSNKAKIYQAYEIMKFWNMWNLDEIDAVEGQDNQIVISAIIDPRTRQHLNVSIKTGTECVRFVNLELPTTVKPFPLIRHQEQPREIDSVSELFEEVSDSRRAECRVDGKRVKTFDNVIYRAPLGECYTIIAKDCQRKSFAVMMKQADEDSENKMIKIVTKQSAIEVQPENGKMVVKINGEKTTDEEDLEENGIDYSEDFVTIRLPQGVSIRFDGQQAKVRVSNVYKNTQCGLCGDYSEESDDEFRTSDNAVTDDLKEFHKSYSLTTNDKECQESRHSKIYNRESLFGKVSQTSDDESDESGIESDKDVEEYGLFGRKQPTENDEDDKENEEENEIVERTKVIEYNHKICFSMKAVKSCPRDSYPSGTEKTKVQFTCLNRSDVETRRLLRESRDVDITDKLVGKKPSFAETVTVPRECSQN